MASNGSSHAACDGQEMADESVSSLLAQEVERAVWPATDSEEDAEYDS